MKELMLTERDVERLKRLSRDERSLWGEGLSCVCGVDEAGRGPLAGPVVAAAVVLPRDCLIPGLNDSKKLSPAKRELVYDLIREAAVETSVSAGEVQTI